MPTLESMKYMSTPRGIMGGLGGLEDKNDFRLNVKDPFSPVHR